MEETGARLVRGWSLRSESGVPPDLIEQDPVDRGLAPVPADEGPVEVRLMDEYAVTFPVWTRDHYPARPGDLPLSEDLTAALAAWAVEFDTRFSVDTFTWDDPALGPAHHAEGHRLLDRLGAELGPGYDVVYLCHETGADPARWPVQRDLRRRVETWHAVAREHYRPGTGWDGEESWRAHLDQGYRLMGELTWALGRRFEVTIDRGQESAERWATTDELRLVITGDLYDQMLAEQSFRRAHERGGRGWDSVESMVTGEAMARALWHGIDLALGPRPPLRIVVTRPLSRPGEGQVFGV